MLDKSWQDYIMKRFVESWKETWEMKVKIVMQFKKMCEKGGSLISKAKPKLGKCHKLGHWKFKYNSSQRKMTRKLEQSKMYHLKQIRKKHPIQFKLNLMVRKVKQLWQQWVVWSCYDISRDRQKQQCTLILWLKNIHAFQ